MRSSRSLLFGAVLALGCQTSSSAGSASGTETGTDTETGTSQSGGTTKTTTATTQASTSPTDSIGTDSAGGTTTGGSADPVVRFVAVGDAGEGNDAQFAVANAMEQICAVRGCDFVLYLGDNFYDTGVTSTRDAQFAEKFELPYQDIALRFYVALGDHDYGLIFNDWDRSQWQVEYTQFSERWYLPSEWYTFEQEHVGFFALDTARLMFDHQTQQQQTWFAGELAASSASWKIAFGHHPYISNGSHGNAGNYEGVSFPDEVSGDDVKTFMDQTLCGNVNVYFSGHDHTRQWLLPQCGTEFIVSGAGAKVTDLSHRDDNPVLYEDDQTPGFLWVEIVGDKFTGVFYDQNGAANFEHSMNL